MQNIHGYSFVTIAQQLLTLRLQADKKKSANEQQDAYLFSTPLSTMLDKPISAIQKWISTSTLRLCQICQKNY
jgi:hypothetical protein